MQFYLSPNKVDVRRVTYGIFNALTDTGGLIKITQVFCKVLIHPVAEFLYFLAMISRIFFAKSTKDDIFNRNLSEIGDQSYSRKRASKYLNIDNLPN